METPVLGLSCVQVMIDNYTTDVGCQLRYTGGGLAVTSMGRIISQELAEELNPEDKMTMTSITTRLVVTYNDLSNQEERRASKTVGREEEGEGGLYQIIISNVSYRDCLRMTLIIPRWTGVMNAAFLALILVCSQLPEGTYNVDNYLKSSRKRRSVVMQLRANNVLSSSHFLFQLLAPRPCWGR